MIGAHPESDGTEPSALTISTGDGVAPERSAAVVDAGRSRLKRIKRPSQRKTEAFEDARTERSKPALRGLSRIAPKKDSEAERRRQKLERLREKIRQRNLAKSKANKSVLSDRVKEAIRKTSAGSAEKIEKAPTAVSEKPTKAALGNRKSGSRRKKKRSSVGWMLDPHEIKSPLDGSVPSGEKSSNSSDAQAVSVADLRAEMERRQQLALSVANFQLDASPSMEVAETAAPETMAEQTEVREVASSRKIAAAADVQRPNIAVTQQASTPAPAAQTEDAAAQLVIGEVTAPTGLAFVEPPPPQIESYRDWFKRVVVRNRWLTWFATFYIHWALLLLLAAIIVHGPNQAADLFLSAAFAIEDETEPVAFEVTVPVSEAEPVAEPQSETEASEEAPAELDEKDLDLEDSILNELVPKGVSITEDSTAHEASEAKNPAVPMTPTERIDMSPPQAVRQGSFSVWTEPPNPRPGESYRIIIQVRLPEGTEKYMVTDLEGVVVGSDGYRKPIPGFAQGELPVVNGYSRLAVPIVSADKKVRDTVFIRSRLLKETQKLIIEFL